MLSFLQGKLTTGDNVSVEEAWLCGSGSGNFINTGREFGSSTSTPTTSTTRLFPGFTKDLRLWPRCLLLVCLMRLAMRSDIQLGGCQWRGGCLAGQVVQAQGGCATTWPFARFNSLVFAHCETFSVGLVLPWYQVFIHL